MTISIALCGVQDEIARALERHGGYKFLRFGDEPERRGDVKLAYFLRHGPAPNLILVGYSRAEGLAACDYLRGQNRALPILWLCDQGEFEPEAKRIGVGFCGTGPPNTEQAIQGILKTIQIRVSEGGTR